MPSTFIMNSKSGFGIIKTWARPSMSGHCKAPHNSCKKNQFLFRKHFKDESHLVSDTHSYSHGSWDSQHQESAENPGSLWSGKSVLRKSQLTIFGNWAPQRSKGRPHSGAVNEVTSHQGPGETPMWNSHMSPSLCFLCFLFGYQIPPIFGLQMSALQLLMSSDSPDSKRRLYPDPQRTSVFQNKCYGGPSQGQNEQKTPIKTSHMLPRPKEYKY